MKNVVPKILLVLIVSMFFVSVVPNVQAADESKADAVILTTQEKGAFTGAVDTGKRVFKTWHVHLYSANVGKVKTFKVVKDGETILEGKFENFHYYEKVIVEQGHISKIRVLIDGEKVLEARDIDCMKKTVSDQEVKKVGEKKIKIGRWEFTQTRLMFSSVGAIAALTAMLFMRIVVKRKMESEILEGY